MQAHMARAARMADTPAWKAQIAASKKQKEEEERLAQLKEQVCCFHAFY